MDSLKLLILVLCVGTLFAADLRCDKFWKMVAAGSSHTLAIDTDGNLYSWGWNENGQTGQGSSFSQINVPFLLLAGTKFKFIEARNASSFAITVDGALYAWGLNDKDQLGLGSSSLAKIYYPERVGASYNWKAVASGIYHTLGLMEDGSLYGWGSNANGQLAKSATSVTAVPERFITTITWKAISAGEAHSVAITTDGQLYACGWNWLGQLGDGTEIDRDRLVPIAHPESKKWKTVSAGGFHNLAIDSSGYLYAWGYNRYGQLGNGDSTRALKAKPTKIGSSNDWKSVSAGHYFSAAIDDDGHLFTWGLNHKYQLGDTTAVDQSYPRRVDGGYTWKSVSAGGGHIAAIQSDETIESWGASKEGQQGNGDPDSHSAYIRYCPSRPGFSFTSSFSSKYLVIGAIVLGLFILFVIVFIIVRAKQNQSQQMLQQQLATSNTTQLVMLPGGQADVPPPQYVAQPPPQYVAQPPPEFVAPPQPQFDAQPEPQSTAPEQIQA